MGAPDSTTIARPAIGSTTMHARARAMRRPVTARDAAAAPAKRMATVMAPMGTVTDATKAMTNLMGAMTDASGAPRSIMATVRERMEAMTSATVAVGSVMDAVMGALVAVMDAMAAQTPAPASGYRADKAA